jgi:hypothetical protein
MGDITPFRVVIYLLLCNLLKKNGRRTSRAYRHGVYALRLAVDFGLKRMDMNMHIFILKLY